MTYDEAIDAVHDFKTVRRACWGAFEAVNLTPVTDFETDIESMQVTRWEFDNTEGIPTGECDPYTPSDEDPAATDWEIYDPEQLRDLMDEEEGYPE